MTTEDTPEKSASEIVDECTQAFSKTCHFDKVVLGEAIKRAVESIGTVQSLEVAPNGTTELEAQGGTVGICVDSDDENAEDVLAVLVKKVSVAMDSGAVANVINPNDLPDDVTPAGNPGGKCYYGADGTPIARYGHADTTCQGKAGTVICRWQTADVTKALQSVSMVCGPADQPGRQDVLFNNDCCYVVPPGIVEQIIKSTKPVAVYPRCGNLYMADVEVSSFARQAPAR